VEKREGTIMRTYDLDMWFYLGDAGNVGDEVVYPLNVFVCRSG
jgi:hypothetical protein